SLALRYNHAPALAGWRNVYSLNYATGDQSAFMLTVGDSRAPNGRATLGAHMAFPWGWLTASGCKYTDGTGVPTTGTWEVGDRIFRANPRDTDIPPGTPPGTPPYEEGWICVQSGTAGR